MRIASITAGAAGMFCGSCMRDNTLAAALCAQGHDALLIPTYTPIRTDEEDVSQKRVFFGGINVYLEQKSGFFRHTPGWLDRLLSFPRLLRWVSRFAVSVRPEELGDLTVSMLQGTHGKQRKEIDKLASWFAEHWKPDIILLTNVLLSGMVPELKRRLKVPIIATLQGDDIFLESLPELYRRQALGLIQENCRAVDGYLVTCNYYADFMAEYLGLPRQRMHVVYPGIKLPASATTIGDPTRSDRLPAIGYFARIAPEKGLHLLAEAFILLGKAGAPPCRLRISGWLGAHQQPYFENVMRKLAGAGMMQQVEYVPSPNYADKVRFLQSLDILSVPTTYREPKGLYVLEALAQGVPVVQPRHGSFPELIDMTGGGLLVKPEDPAHLASELRRLLDDEALRRELGQRGQAAVREHFTAEVMAQRTVDVLRQYTDSPVSQAPSSPS